MPSVESLFIVGIVVSLLVQYLKSTFGTREYLTLGVVVFISLVASWVYVTWKDTSFWPTLLEVLKWAATIYAFIIQRFENKDEISVAEVKGMFKS
jgi:hypothetical protein